MPYLRVCWEVQWSGAITNDKVYADLTLSDCKQIPRAALSPRISTQGHFRSCVSTLRAEGELLRAESDNHHINWVQLPAFQSSNGTRQNERSSTKWERVTPP